MGAADRGLWIAVGRFDACQDLCGIDAALFEEIGPGAFVVGRDGGEQILGVRGVAAMTGGFVERGDQRAAHPGWEALPHIGGLYAEKAPRRRRGRWRLGNFEQCRNHHLETGQDVSATQNVTAG